MIETNSARFGMKRPLAEEDGVAVQGMEHELPSAVVRLQAALRDEGDAGSLSAELLSEASAAASLLTMEGQEALRLESELFVGLGRLTFGEEEAALGPLLQVATSSAKLSGAEDRITAAMAVLPLLRKRCDWPQVLTVANAARDAAMGAWVDPSLPYIKGIALMHLDRLAEARNCFKDAVRVDKDFVAAYLEYDSVATRLGKFEQCRQMAQKLVDRGGHWVSCWQRPRHFLTDKELSSLPWHDAATFDVVRKLESSFAAIKGELLELLASGASWGRVGTNDRGNENPTHDNLLLDRGDWREIVLLGDASKAKSDIVDKCPETMRVLRGCPEVAQAAELKLGESLFSRLVPGTRLKPHCGPTNMRLTCHLALVVPGGATITCGGETRTWVEGKCLVFDDSYEHEVTHDGDADRIVLLVNFWHPALEASRWKALVEEAVGTAGS